MDVLTGKLADAVAATQQRLDEHVREIVAWHFDPKTGSPFWLERAAAVFDFDPVKEIGGFDDLKIFGPFEDDWLRGGPVRRWVPKGLADKPEYVFGTGGSTGVPKSRVNIEDFQRDYEIFGDNLSDETFPRGADWLMLGPTGPRRLRLAIEHLAQYRGGISFHIDLDPRWVNKLIRRSEFQELELYKQHTIDQALTILRAHDSIKCLFTTPKLLEALCEKISLPRMGITGIFCGGTEMNAQFNRFAREELVPGIDFVPTYGNTLMGLAAPKPFDPADNYKITYFAPQPRAVAEVVSFDDHAQTVDYAETGRVKLYTLTKELFIPGFLERDEGEREQPHEKYPWDGVSGVRPFHEFAKTTTVGVY